MSTRMTEGEEGTKLPKSKELLPASERNIDGV